jgi:hypothetical protein
MRLNAEQRFKRAVVVLWHKGVYPGPTALNERLSGRRSRHLGGCRPRWRREVFAELGIPLQRPSPLRGTGGCVLNV